jgi:hypothetical protein
MRVGLLNRPVSGVTVAIIAMAAVVTTVMAAVVTTVMVTVVTTMAIVTAVIVAVVTAPVAVVVSIVWTVIRVAGIVTVPRIVAVSRIGIVSIVVVRSIRRSVICVESERRIKSGEPETEAAAAMSRGRTGGEKQENR